MQERGYRGRQRHQSRRWIGYIHNQISLNRVFVQWGITTSNSEDGLDTSTIGLKGIDLSCALLITRGLVVFEARTDQARLRKYHSRWVAYSTYRWSLQRSFFTFTRTLSLQQRNTLFVLQGRVWLCKWFGRSRDRRLTTEMISLLFFYF